MRIVFKVILFIISVILIILLIINLLIVFLKQDSINLNNISPKNIFFKETKIICILNDRNITINDIYNNIVEIEINTVSKISITINSKNIRHIYINNEKVKLKTAIDSLRIIDEYHIKLGGWMGAHIDNIKSFKVDKNQKFTFSYSEYKSTL